MDIQKLTFAGAVGVCFKKFFDFKGVAGRREYWYFVLFFVLVSVVTGQLDQILFPELSRRATESAEALFAYIDTNPTVANWSLFERALSDATDATPIGNFAGLVTFLPLVTAMVRRMRDAGFSAWFLFLSWVPFLTFIFTVLPTKPQQTKPQQTEPKPSPSA